MHKIITGDCLNIMRSMDNNSIDFIVTDPPYGLHFMGKGWDKFKKSNYDENGKHKHLENYSVDNRTCDVRKIMTGNSLAGTYDEKRNDEFQEFMRIVGIEALRIVKPGGHIAMFGAPRRHHRQMSGLEDAGWEIRDCIAWIFGSGFPKSHNNFGLPGYGTALKPAYEPIIIAMKPLDGTYKQNVEKWGIGGINIDESRIRFESEKEKLKHAEEWNRNWTTTPIHHFDKFTGNHPGEKKEIGNGPKQQIGRWPANLILDEEAAAQLDQMTGNNVSRFFYVAKASSSERNAGLDKPSSHPTVKPIALMKYILKLLAPPNNPICLDPFCGSGTTLVAAKELGISCIGIEKEPEYAEIAQKRINNARFKPEQLTLPLTNT